MIPIIDGVVSLVTTWLSGYNQKKKAQLDISLAEMQNKARLMSDESSNNHAWEMASLTDKDKWLRRLSFAMFASPFVIALISPDHVAAYFHTAINSVPIWWQKTFMSITGGIWGLSSLKNILPGVVDVLKKK